jgi:hypothetical protein
LYKSSVRRDSPFSLEATMPQTPPKTPSKLARWIENDLTTITIVRDLTPEEIQKNDHFMPLTGEAMERLVLFKMLAQNYSEWRSYITSLLSGIPFGAESEEKMKLNRLLLNYLTCAYTIQEHFKVSLKQRFRAEPAKIKEYDSFMERLCKKSPETAFFLDFRGYVQHRGFGITTYRRHVTPTSVDLTIACDADDLVRESRSWERSGLSGEEGNIEIVPKLAGFHVHLLKSYGQFVAKLIYPELEPAAKFYTALTREAVQRRSQYRMIFCEAPEVEQTEAGTKTGWSLLCGPNDVFAEAGLVPSKFV